MAEEQSIRVPVARWYPNTESEVVTQFLNRPAFDATAEATAARVLADIRQDGDEAVAKYVKEFDGAALEPAAFAVTTEERKAAMVSNLLVVLCGNHDAQPVVNSGSLY